MIALCTDPPWHLIVFRILHKLKKMSHFSPEESLGGRATSWLDGVDSCQFFCN